MSRRWGIREPIPGYYSPFEIEEREITWSLIDKASTEAPPAPAKPAAEYHNQQKTEVFQRETETCNTKN